MTAAEAPLRAGASSGDVIVRMSPAVAREVASVWASAHALTPARGVARPSWTDDVVELYTAAVDADEQRGIRRRVFRPLSIVTPRKNGASR